MLPTHVARPKVSWPFDRTECQLTSLLTYLLSVSPHGSKPPIPSPPWTRFRSPLPFAASSTPVPLPSAPLFAPPPSPLPQRSSSPPCVAAFPLAPCHRHLPPFHTTASPFLATPPLSPTTRFLFPHADAFSSPLSTAAFPSRDTSSPFSTPSSLSTMMCIRHPGDDREKEVAAWGRMPEEAALAWRRARRWHTTCKAGRARWR